MDAGEEGESEDGGSGGSLRICMNTVDFLENYTDHYLSRRI